MQFVAEDGLFFRRYFSIGRATRFPVATGGGERHKMKLNSGQRQTIDDALVILGHIQTLEDAIRLRKSPIGSCTIESPWRNSCGLTLALIRQAGFHNAAQARRY